MKPNLLILAIAFVLSSTALAQFDATTGKFKSVVVNTVIPLDIGRLLGTGYKCIYEYGGTFHNVPAAQVSHLVESQPNGKLFPNREPGNEQGWIKLYLVKEKDYLIPKYQAFSDREYFVHVEGRVDGTSDGEEQILHLNLQSEMYAERNSKKTEDLCLKLYNKHLMNLFQVTRGAIDPGPGCSKK